MATPDLPRTDLAKWMRDMERRIAQVEKRDSFTNTGLSVPAAGVTAVDGAFESANYAVGSTGWALTSDGNAEFNALTLRQGIIGNNALTNPVDGKAGNVSATGYALSAGSLVELAGQDIAVPSGFTQAIGLVGATVFAYNPNTTGGSNGAGADAIYCQAALAGVSSHANPVGVSGSNGYATSFSAAGFNLTGLTGGSTIRLSVYGASAYAALAANGSNYANAYASIIWLR